ncbi:MAG: malonic semialdehyde reductase [Caulobacteraceae bacterium]
MTGTLDTAALNLLFNDARSRNAWVEETLPEKTWRDLYDLVKHAPTSMNISPSRFVFVTSEAGKARLIPHILPFNQAKTQSAPCSVIIGTDMAFYEKMPQLFPARPNAKDMFTSDLPGAEVAGFRNGSMQAGYLILAARALGLDVGPMSGFLHDGIDNEFFAGTQIKSNMIINLGHGTDKSFDRLPRLSFEDACQIL